MNNKTQTFRKKGRALFLAAIMVLSVVAMTATFAGSAAAAASNVSLDDSTVTEGDTLSGTVSVDTSDDSSAFVFVDANDDGFWNQSEEPFVEVDVTQGDGNTVYNFDGLETDGIVGTQVGSFVDSSATDGQAAEVTTSVTINNDLNVELDAPEVVQDQNNYPAEVTVTNEGDADATGVDIDLALDAPPSGSNIATSSSTGNTLAPGDSETISVVVDASDTVIGNVSNGISTTVSGDNYGPETVEQNARVGQNGTAFIDGNIGDDQVNPIEDDQDIRLVVDNTDTGDEVVNETFGNFDTLADNNGFVANAGFTSSSDRAGDLLGTYFIEFNQVETTANYTFNASLEGFEAFDGPATGTIGEQSDRNLRLTRIVDADRLEVTDPPEDSAFDLQESFDATVLVETEDTEENGIGSLAPLEDEDVVASNFTASWDNPNDADADLEITPTTNTTESDGTTQFAISLDLQGNSPDDFDEDIDAGIRFDATTSDEFDILNVTFQAEPPSGEGTISGTVDELDPTIDIGAEEVSSMSNIEAGVDTSVHAVRFDRVAENTGPEGDIDGSFFSFDDGSEEDIPIDNVEEASSEVSTLQSGADVFVRVAALNDTGPNAQVVDILDVQTDYLFTNDDDLELARNLSIQGSGFNVHDDDGFGDFQVHVIDPGDYQIQATADGNFSSGVLTTNFTADNDLSYEATKDRYADSQAVHTDVTNEHGDFELLNLFTDDDETDYVVMAGEDNGTLGFANARGYDVGEVYPNSHRDRGDDPEWQHEVDLSVQQAEVTIVADTVDITQFGTHPPVDEVPNAPQVSEIDEFGEPPLGQDKTDDTFQQVSRDGTVDVIRVDTNSSEFDEDLASDVTVELNDSFDGQFLDVVLDGQLNADSSLLLNNDQENTTIDISTDANGTAFVLLETEANASTLNTQKIASIDNGGLNQDEDRSNVTFVGTTTFESAGVSGISRDSDDTLVPNAVVWAEEFEWAVTGSAPYNGQRIEIEPDTTATPGTPAYANFLDDPNADFLVTLFAQNSSGVFVEVDNDTATRSELTSYQFSAFPSLSTSGTFQLTDVVEDPETASYTLEPIPAVVGVGATDYTLRGVKLDSPEIGAESLTGTFNVVPGEGGTQNIIFPFDIEAAILEVSGVSSQTITEGENATVDATIENTGGEQGSDQTVELIVDGDVVASQDVDVSSGDTQTVTLEGDTSDLAPGDYDLSVTTDDASQTATLTVESSSNWWDDYTDDNGVADLDGALDAIDDYDNDDLSLDRVLIIIDSYESGTPVPDLIE